MIVVILIGILAVMAIPALGDSRIDQHGYQAAADIADLVREARSHAMGRGAATLVTLSAGKNDNGTFTMYEAVGPNPQGVGGLSPRTTCRAPTTWGTVWTTGAPPAGAQVFAHQIQQIAIPASDVAYGFQARVFEDTGTPSQRDQVNICFTPLGRTYMTTNQTGSGINFDAADPMAEVAQVEIARKVNSNVQGFVRRVIIPPSGSARILSTGALLP